MPLYLHFLSGTLNGQSLRLPEGDVTCGPGEDCDIHLPLSEGSAGFTLQCTAGEVRLVGELPCLVDGEPMDGDMLPADCVLEVAGYRMMLSALADPVLPLSLPALTASSPAALRAHYPLRYLPGGLFLLLCTILALLLFRSATPTESLPVITAQAAVAQVQQSLPALRLEWRSPRQVVLSGYYPNQETLQVLLRTMKRHAVHYQLQAFDEEALRDSVHYLAARFGYEDLTVSAGKQPGEVDIAGAIIADDIWRQFLRELGSIEGLTHWEIKNIALMNTADLLRLVKTQRLLGQVSIERDKQRYTITGQLNEQQKAALNAGIQRLTGGHQDNIVFQNMVPVSPSDRIFPSPVVSVGGSRDKPFVELQDGRRLQPGARLDNHYEIVAIDAKYGIDLLGEDNLLHYAFTF